MRTYTDGPKKRYPLHFQLQKRLILVTGCLQLLEISWNLKTLLEISWNSNGPPGNFCVMIENWLMALLHDDVALFVH